VDRATPGGPLNILNSDPEPESWKKIPVWTLCRELCKSGWTDRDAVWDADSAGSTEHVYIGYRYPHGNRHFGSI